MTSLAGFPVSAPLLPGPVTFAQFWADLTFIHWPVRPEHVARHCQLEVVWTFS